MSRTGAGLGDRTQRDAASAAPATAGLAVQLTAAWDLRGSALVQAFPTGAGDTAARVLLDGGLARLVLPAVPLTRPGLGAALVEFGRGRARVEASHPGLLIPGAAFGLTLCGTGNPLLAATHVAVVERLAPALVLLLCRHGFDRVRTEVCGDGITLKLDDAPPDEHLRLVVPVIAAMAARLLADAHAGACPPLLRHPWLCAAGTDGLRITVPPPATRDMLTAGRSTPVHGVTPDGVRCTVPLQRSLETLSLYAAAEIDALLEPAAAVRARALIAGGGVLPVERRLGRSAPAATTPDARPLTLVLVEPCARPRPHGIRFAQLFARLDGVEVLVVPWFNLRLLASRRGVVVGRAALRLRDGELVPVVIDGSRQVDALYAHLTDAAGPPGDSPPERAAVAHLAAMGMDVSGLQRQTLVDRLLCRAARSGVRTNGVGWEGEFALKGLFEGIAADYERATGESLPRPHSLVGSREQVPAMIDTFTGSGEWCVVKVSGGTRGEGTAVLGPGDSWSPPERGEAFVVQELLRRPLLLDGHKADLRCHLLVDAGDPRRSRRIGPVLMRRAGIAWQPGDIDAEVVNRARPGPVPDLHPLELTPGMSDAERAELLDAVEATADRLLEMHRWWATSGPGSRRDREARRLQHWGVDLFAGRDESGRLDLRVLDVNVHPQLFRDLDDCDAAVGEMLLHDYMPALLDSAPPSTPTPSIAARAPSTSVVADAAGAPLGIAVLHPGEQPRQSDILVAAALSRAAGAPAHLCRWTALDANGRALHVSGVTVPVVAGELRSPGALPPPATLDVLWADTLRLGELPSVAGDVDRDALQRLTEAGLADTAEKSLFAHTEQLLLGAARRGIVTNACGVQSAWGDKARLEDMLRACARGGGPDVARPRTHPAHGSQAGIVVDALHAAGLDCVVKPAVGSWGEGISLHLRGDETRPPRHPGEVVVQELIADPLLVEGRKLDLRCHVLVDVARPRESCLLGPIVARTAARPYVRGEPLAEITNMAFQESHGVGTALIPLDELAGLSAASRATVTAGATALVADLCAAHAWWAEAIRGGDPGGAESRRILIWALDILVTTAGGRPRALLAEVNVRPQLVHDGVTCFAEVETMLDAGLGPALVRAARRTG